MFGLEVEQFTRVVYPEQGFQSCNEHVVHIGLGARNKIDAVEVTWTSGVIDRFEDIEVDFQYVIRESTRTSIRNPNKTYSAFV